MGKLSIQFNEEATNLTGFVGIIGSDSDSGQVISDKIKACVEDAIDKVSNRKVAWKLTDVTL